MNVPQLAARTAVCRWFFLVLGLMILPVAARSGAPLSEQLVAAQGDKDDASVAEICRRELASAPGDVGLLRDLFRAQLALTDYGRAAETLARLDEAGAPAALRAELRGDLAQAADKPPGEALAAWKEALADHPEDASVLEGKIADALDKAGRWDEAANALRAFLRAKPDHAARTDQLAVCLLNAGHPEEADKQALAAGRIDAADETVKTDAPMFDRLRAQLPALRQLGERIAVFKQEGSEAAKSRIERALILYRAGAYPAALEEARQADKDTQGRMLLARLIEGQCHWRLDAGDEEGTAQKEAVALRVAKIEDARWFDDAKRCERLLAPDELGDRADAAAVVRADAGRSVVLLEGNQPVLALEDAEKAIRAEEKAGRRTADTEVVLAAALLRNDRPADALAAARRATGADPRNPDGWALCGRLEQEGADFSAAVQDLSRALDIRVETAWLRRRETCLRVLGRNAEADRDARRDGAAVNS